MFLTLNHKNLDVYAVCKSLVIECYRLTKQFPPEEKYALTNQIRRAATSILLNLCEGASRKSLSERKRFYEVSRGSLIEMDAAIEISFGLGYFEGLDLADLQSKMIRSFQMLSKMIDPD
jgi:four helix bundle protein